MKYDDAFAPLPANFAHRPGKPDDCRRGGAEGRSKRIVGFSLEKPRCGRQALGRRAATPAFMHTIEWTVNAFKTAGLHDARMETTRSRRRCGCQHRGGCRSWAMPRSAPARRRSRSSRRFRKPGGASIPGGSLTAPVDLCRPCTDADLAGRDLRGKIAVLRVRPERRCSAPVSKVRPEIAKLGAVAVSSTRSKVPATHSMSTEVRVRRGTLLHDRRSGRLVPADGDRKAAKRPECSTR